MGYEQKKNKDSKSLPALFVWGKVKIKMDKKTFRVRVQQENLQEMMRI